MKRYALLLLVTLLVALPTLAQTALGATYTLDTGTSINYPDNWIAELQEDFVILSHTDLSRAIVLDYPLVSQLIQSDPSLTNAVEVVADQLSEGNYDAELITTFTILGREAARYDLVGDPTSPSGSIVAVRFSNERIGIVIAINITSNILDPMLESFDNTSPASDNVILQGRGSTAPLTAADGYIFQAQGRFSIPAGWSYIPAMLGENIEYVNLRTADATAGVLIFDLSNVISNNLTLDTVVAASGINFERDFGLGYDTGEFARQDNREVYRYAVTVNGQAGTMVVVHFDNGGTGLFVAYGNTAAHTHDINVLLGSFTDVGATLNYIQ
jgi:hypothetical protein